MAIDTQNKRRSALRFALPVPDGFVDLGDRVQVTWNYMGFSSVPILTGAAIVHGPRDTHIAYGPASTGLAHGPKNTGEVNG